MKKTDLKTIRENKILLNILTPISGIEYKTNRMRIGDTFAKIYTIVKYPQNVSIGWLSKITNIPDTISTQIFEPTDNTLLLENISKGIKQNEALLNTISDAVERQRIERELASGEELIKKIDNDGETVGYMTILIMVIAESEEELSKRCKKVEAKLSSMQLKIRCLASLVKNAFRCIVPFFNSDKKIKDIAKRNVPLSSFIGGLPFASSGFNDGTGYYFAKDVDGGLIVLDTWKRGNDRTNSNFVIMGTAGVGKSTVTKHLILNEIMLGNSVLIIDPESEYDELTKNLGGDCIDVSGGNDRGRINPLQIKPAPKDDDNEEIKGIYDKGKGIGEMALHFQTLRIFFKLLFPELTSIQMAILEEILEDLYNKFNIYWETDISNLKNTDFPIMSDLYRLVKIYYEKELNSVKKENINILLSLIRQISEGADNCIFNGYTTIEKNNKIVCLDTGNIQNASENVKKAQYFNVLSWCWEQISKNRKEKTMLIADEAYLLIDKNCMQSIAFLRNVAKRCRKYEGSLVIVSHSIIDFLDDSVKMYGQAILDMATYKILMGTDGRNLEDTMELFKLTENQADFLSNKKRGYAILIIGAYKILVKFEIYPYEFEYFGKSGGR